MVGVCVYPIPNTILSQWVLAAQASKIDCERLHGLTASTISLQAPTPDVKLTTKGYRMDLHVTSPPMVHQV